MANRVTQENIIEMNEIYLKCGTYAETARRTGFSASTVKKYIIPNYISKEAIVITNPFSINDIPAFDKTKFENIDWSDDYLYRPTAAEIDDLKELWKELLL